MKISLKTIVLGFASLLAIIAFCMMFVTPLTVKVFGMESAVDFKNVYFPEGPAKSAWTSVIGFALMLVAALAILFSLFANEKLSKYAKVAAVLMLIVGAVLVFLTKTLFLSFNEAPSEYAGFYGLGIGPIIGGILAIVSSVCVVGSKFVK